MSVHNQNIVFDLAEFGPVQFDIEFEFTPAQPRENPPDVAGIFIISVTATGRAVWEPHQSSFTVQPLSAKIDFTPLLKGDFKEMVEEALWALHRAAVKEAQIDASD